MCCSADLQTPLLWDGTRPFPDLAERLVYGDPKFAPSVRPDIQPADKAGWSQVLKTTNLARPRKADASAGWHQ
jgi:hypothetical protein